jgi:hypothetical protein
LAGAVAGGIMIYYAYLVPTNELPEIIKITKEKPSVVSGYNKENLPSFEDFPVSEKFEGQPAPVNFSTDPDALRFVTAITEGAEKGPNFAGHYTVISWGCGTECESGVIVDAQTGAISSSFVTELGSEFRIDSNLFIVNPLENIIDLNITIYPEYYKWEDDKLVFLYSERIEKERIEKETADWETYINDEYGFEIKYPQNLNPTPGEYCYYPDCEKELLVSMGWPLLLDIYNVAVAEGKIYVSVEGKIYVNVSPYSVDEYASDETSDLADAGEMLSLGYEKQKTIDGILFNRISDDNCDMQGCRTFRGYRTIRENKLYVITLELRYSSGIYKADYSPEEITKVENNRIVAEKNSAQLFNQMLSTFKFIEE